MLHFNKPEEERNKTRVLIVDDETTVTRMVKRNLEATGDYQVEAVNDSIDAVNRAKEFLPHIILLDIVMPQADGGDVANGLRSRSATKNIPIIFVSAMVSPKEAQRGLYESGGEHFLAKPINTEILSEAIETVLSLQK
ncbi:MAG: response regulator [Opitutales bacterium]